MKKVLVVSYFFPPCNLTASQRAFSWATYLYLFGYYPIIITRRWDNPIKTLTDISEKTPQEIGHEKHDTYEVYYLPHQQNLRDKIYASYGNGKFVLLRRLLTFIELVFQNFFTAFIPYKNLFEFADELTRKDTSIKKMIISGNPYHQFKLGYFLQKRRNIKWVADYRDAWTTSEINLNRSAIFEFINFFDRFFEKKWVSTASFITASSAPIAQGITEITGVKSSALYNGFIAEDFSGLHPPKFAEFTITYVGTLYHGQKVEIFCAAYKKIIDAKPGIKIKLLFPGLSFYGEQLERIQNTLKGYEKHFSCTDRMERKKILEIEKSSHLLFHVAWDEQKGIIASKIYEYIASGTFILVTPSDNGSVQEIIEKSGCGVCTSTVNDTFAFLMKEYENFEKGIYRANDIDKETVKQFSRVEQVKTLAQIFDSMKT